MTLIGYWSALVFDQWVITFCKETLGLRCVRFVYLKYCSEPGGREQQPDSLQSVYITPCLRDIAWLLQHL